LHWAILKVAKRAKEDLSILFSMGNLSKILLVDGVAASGSGANAPWFLCSRAPMHFTAFHFCKKSRLHCSSFHWSFLFFFVSFGLDI
jgi:hypothetical protein